MKHPKFKPNQKVFCRYLKKTGVVVCCINEKEVEDVKEQGFRYYVDVAGQRYSMKEKSLLLQEI
jgi:hypothetical protein